MALCFFRQPCRGRGSTLQGWGNFVPPGTTHFFHGEKVGKTPLRGSTPKDPDFLEQGRGGVYISNGIGRTITYGPWHSPNYACRPVKMVSR